MCQLLWITQVFPLAKNLLLCYDTNMLQYELTLILNPGLEKEALDKLLVKVKKTISDSSGKVEKVDEWGKRPLAYPIKKQKEGVYFLVSFEIAPDKVKDLEGKIKAEENLLRHLLIKKE